MRNVFFSCLRPAADAHKPGAQSNEPGRRAATHSVVEALFQGLDDPVSVFSLSTGGLIFSNVAAARLENCRSLDVLFAQDGMQLALNAVQSGETWRGLVQFSAPVGNHTLDKASPPRAAETPRPSLLAPAAAKTAHGNGSQQLITPTLRDATSPSAQSGNHDPSAMQEKRCCRRSAALGSEARNRRWARGLFAKSNRNAEPPLRSGPQTADRSRQCMDAGCLRGDSKAAAAANAEVADAVHATSTTSRGNSQVPQLALSPSAPSLGVQESSLLLPGTFAAGASTGDAFERGFLRGQLSAGCASDSVNSPRAAVVSSPFAAFSMPIEPTSGAHCESARKDSASVNQLAKGASLPLPQVPAEKARTLALPATATPAHDLARGDGADAVHGADALQLASPFVTGTQKLEGQGHEVKGRSTRRSSSLQHSPNSLCLGSGALAHPRVCGSPHSTDRRLMEALVHSGFGVRMAAGRQRSCARHAAPCTDGASTGASAHLDANAQQRTTEVDMSVSSAVPIARLPTDSMPLPTTASVPIAVGPIGAGPRPARQLRQTSSASYSECGYLRAESPGRPVPPEDGPVQLSGSFGVLPRLFSLASKAQQSRQALSRGSVSRPFSFELRPESGVGAASTAALVARRSVGSVFGVETELGASVPLATRAGRSGGGAECAAMGAARREGHRSPTGTLSRHSHAGVQGASRFGQESDTSGLYSRCSSRTGHDAVEDLPAALVSEQAEHEASAAALATHGSIMLTMRSLSKAMELGPAEPCGLKRTLPTVFSVTDIAGQLGAEDQSGEQQHSPTSLDAALEAAVPGGKAASDDGASVAAVREPSADVERWHEVTVRGMRHPESGEQLVVVTQHDVSARVWAEQQLARVMEAEHLLLESIFPQHVLEHIAVVAAATSEAADGCTPDSEHRVTGNGFTSRPTLRALAASAAAAAVAAGLASVPAAHGPQPSAIQQLGIAAVSSPLPITGDTFLHLATSHSALTILFCDIQGFTSMCGVVKPATVMAFLNDLYTRLDAMLDAFGVYKVETIGDCYVAAGGLMRVDEETGAVTVRSDDVDPQHAHRTVQFAKALLRAASAVRLPHSGESVRLRVGIHSGPAMSGVVGTRMPRFCLFGDTINTASRMESTGQPGAIHVSQATRDLTPEEDWVPTGGVEAKGKGRMQTFLLRPP